MFLSNLVVCPPWSLRCTPIVEWRLCPCQSRRWPGRLTSKPPLTSSILLCLRSWLVDVGSRQLQGLRFLVVIMLENLIRLRGQCEGMKPTTSSSVDRGSGSNTSSSKVAQDTSTSARRRRACLLSWWHDQLPNWDFRFQWLHAFTVLLV